ncbi:MAG: cytochrome c3 family protein [Fimbriimonadales bacterium]
MSASNTSNVRKLRRGWLGGTGLFTAVAMIGLGMAFGSGFTSASTGTTVLASVVATKTPPKCAMCHAPLAKNTMHVKKGVACESCHTGTEAHLKSPKNKPGKPTERSACLSCHQKAGSKAPQVDGAKHNPKKFCATCHDIHGKKK